MEIFIEQVLIPGMTIATIIILAWFEETVRLHRTKGKGK